jgi:hypothetical protein
MIRIDQLCRYSLLGCLIVGAVTRLHALQVVNFIIEYDSPAQLWDSQVSYYAQRALGVRRAFDLGGGLDGNRHVIQVEIGRQRAQSLKMALYTRGCAFEVLSFAPIPRGDTTVKPRCSPLPTLRMNGIIQGYSRPAELEIRIDYLAYWLRSYYGIEDERVPEFQLVQFSPDAAGRFYIELPNLTVDPVSNRYRNPAELRLSAQDKASYERYWLTPPNATKKGMMPIMSGDTVEMVFVAEKIQ